MTAIAEPITVTPAVRARERLWHLDAIRGLAVLLMVLDHILIWHLSLFPVRETLTRAAMPLFFVLSGSLVRRLTWRHLGILVVGMVLPVVVPWVDAPNVLVWYVLGAALIRLADRWQLHAFWPVLVAVPLVEFANRLNVAGWGQSYTAPALFGLMFLGTALPRDWWSWGQRLPRWMARVGRYPLSVYVGHLLAIQTFVLLWRRYA